MFKKVGLNIRDESSMVCTAATEHYRLSKFLLWESMDDDKLLNEALAIYTHSGESLISSFSFENLRFKASR